MSAFPASYERVNTCWTCRHVWRKGPDDIQLFCCFEPESRQTGEGLYNALKQVSFDNDAAWGAWETWESAHLVDEDGHCKEYKWEREVEK